MSYPIKVWTGSQWEEIGLSGGALAITAPPDISASGAVGSTTVLARADHTHGFDPDTFDLLDTATASATYLPISASATLGGGSSASVDNGVIISSVFISPEERFNVLSASAAGTVNIDVATSTAWVYENVGNENFTINIRGDGSNSLNSLLDTGDAITVGLLNATGTTASAFFATAIQVDGSSITPKWINNSEPPASLPTQSSSGYDSYTITLVKTASAEYIALGSWAQYR